MNILRNMVAMALIGLWMSTPGQAQQAVAVLSSELGPYLEAFEGFQEAWGAPVTRVNMAVETPRIPSDAQVVVAFGGKAALWSYPEGIALVYCMAPGANLQRQAAVKVHMLPRPGFVLARLKDIQPALHRLSVFWVSESMGDYVQELTAAGEAFGLRILSERLPDGSRLPDGLRRALQQQADAIWMPPDPLLITPTHFAALRSFSWDNNVPLYAPTSGLAEQGATAAIASNFRQIGQAAAQAARAALASRSGPGAIYPETFETILNLTAFAQTGLQTALDRIKADRIIP